MVTVKSFIYGPGDQVEYLYGSHRYTGRILQRRMTFFRWRGYAIVTSSDAVHMVFEGDVFGRVSV